MEKVTGDFVRESFGQAVTEYTKAIEEIGLWESEKYVFNKYFSDNNKSILDIGCGAGRTTFALYELGYHNIIGLDLTPEMIDSARELNKKRGTDIEFITGDATDLNFADNSFGYALFSFNGLMQIPKRANRIQALKEIRRVIKPGGIFIFTTHDRENNENYKEFWEKEEKIWAAGKEDERVYEYGDKILPAGEDGRDTFIHFPDRQEIVECLKEARLQLLEDFYREALIEESDEIKKFSAECRFWITKK